MAFVVAAVIVAGAVVPAQAGSLHVTSLATQVVVAGATDVAVIPSPQDAPTDQAATVTPPAEAVQVAPDGAAAPTLPVPTDPATDPAATPPHDDNVIVVEGDVAPPKEDPLARVNAQAYEVTQQVDDAVVGPIAKGYKEGLPGPIRKGVRNFFANLREPVVTINFLLQGKVGKAFETVGRFAINSTVGVAGLFDVAKNDPVNLPRRNNGFANTLGFYGVKPGPYLVLPLVGSTTVRDLFGSFVDATTLPTIVGAPFNSPYYGVPAYTLRSLDYRIAMDETLTEIRESDDPYVAAREHYLQQRQAEIDALHGRVAPQPDTVAAPTAAPAVSPPPPPPPPASTQPVKVAPPAAPVDRSQDMAWQSAQQAYLAGLSTNDGWQYLPGGLRWRRVEGDGSGPHPTVADMVTVHYAGTFIDGTGFDSSWERGEPATFPLGRLIPAWQRAIPQMGVGDTIEIAAPALLAYGPVGKGPIPGGATLLFKVQLLGIGGGE